MSGTELPFPVHFGEPPHVDPPAPEYWVIPGMGLAPPTISIATWSMVDQFDPGQQMPPILSLRGVLPQHVLDSSRCPAMAIDVDDGQPVPHGAFEAAVAWLDAHQEFSPPGPFVCCWLGQSRSVVFASVWLARRHKAHLTEAFEYVCKHRPGAAPNAVLVRSAYEWMGFKVPKALR